MVKIDANLNQQTQNTQELLSTIFLSIGALTLIVTLFLGIKWKRFRYRMTFQNTPGENLITIRRHSSTTTIRENCSEGRYRHSTTEELITNGNDIQPTLRNTTAYNVKLESSDRGSIFRWPFRNKMKVSSSSFTIDENRILDSNEEAVHRRERDSMLAEKNERIRRSIYERLNSSTSMPDLVSDSQSGTYAQRVEEPILVIQKGVESELDESAHYQIVDEIHDTKVVETVPVRVKEDPASEAVPYTFEKCKQNDKIAENAKEIEVVQNPVPPKPPTRRRSKASDLKVTGEKNNTQEIEKVPPAVKPRKRISNLTVTIDQPSREVQDFSRNEAVLSKKHEEVIMSDTEIAAAKKMIEAILSPPIEYKDTSLSANTAYSNEIEDISPIISSETLTPAMTYDQDSSPNLTPEIAKYEHDFSINKDTVDSAKVDDDSFINTIDLIPSKKQESSLTKEPILTPTENQNSDYFPLSPKSPLPSQDQDFEIKLAIVTPKSILKSQQDTSTQSKSTVQFVNVPDSSTDDDDDYQDCDDVWSKIEVHRNQLMQNHEFNGVYISSSSNEDVPPPLPKTPPPTADIQERNFEFA